MSTNIKSVIICSSLIISIFIFLSGVRLSAQDSQNSSNSQTITPQPVAPINQNPVTPTELSKMPLNDNLLPCKKGQMEESGGMISVFYQVAPEYGSAFANLLDKWKSKEGRIIYTEKFQLLTITDHKENIALMEQVMQISDISAPQIMIEAQILERNIKSDLQLGWDSSFTKNEPTNTFFRAVDINFDPNAYLQSLSTAGAYGITKAPYPFLQGSTFSFMTTGRRGTTDIKLKTMVERNEATILSSPRVTVSSGSKAIISSGQEVPYSVVQVIGGVTTANTQYKSAEIKLEVIATVIGKNLVKMTILPEVKTVTGYQSLPGAETPIFASRRSETTITIESGQIVHIGGLTREEDVYYERGIPLLSDIPLLGNLFKKQQRDKVKTEIIFIIKPSIIQKPEETIKPSIMEKK